MMNPMQLMQQFNQFKANFSQQHPGMDPKAMVQQLLNSGRMTQQQFEELRSAADMLVGGRR